MTYLVDFRTVEAQHLAAVVFRCKINEVGPRISAAFGQVAQHLGRNGLGPTGPAVAHYRMTGDETEVAAGFEVSKPIEAHGDVVPFDLPAGEVVTTTHVGPYAELPKAYEAIRDQVIASGRRFDEHVPMWERYHSMPDTPPEKTVTEIFWPIPPQEQ